MCSCNGSVPLTCRRWGRFPDARLQGTHECWAKLRGGYTKATRLYRLETSTALGATPDVWTNSSLGTFAPDAGSTTSKVISWPGAAKKFIRAAAVLPLQ